MVSGGLSTIKLFATTIKKERQPIQQTIFDKALIYRLPLTPYHSLLTTYCLPVTDFMQLCIDDGNRSHVHNLADRTPQL